MGDHRFNLAAALPRFTVSPGVNQMLTLTRKRGQKINIGPDIVITIERIEGNRVRLAIEAPRRTSILREELLPNSPPRLPVEDAARHTA